MAMPRGMMVMRDRRDRILLQQAPGHGHPHPHPPGPGCPPLHHHPLNPYNLGPGHRFVEGEDEEFGRILPLSNVGWEGHQQQQQALAGAMFRRRINMQHHHPAMLHQQQQALTGQQQPPPQEWDTGPHPAQVHEVLRMRPPPVGVDGEFLAGMRRREEMEMRKINPEHLKLASSRASHEGEFLRNASRASHDNLINIEREQLLKNVYRASHEKLIEKEFMKKAPRGKPPMENDRPSSNVPRPFHHSPLRAMEGKNNQVGHYGGGGGREERTHSDLVIRYGGRQQPGRSQDLSPDSSVPPGFQPVVMPSKRSRDEDMDFGRFRSQRPRRVLGARSISPRPHQRPKEQLDPQSKLHFGGSRKVAPDDDEHEEGQVTPPPPLVRSQRAEPIGPPGFCKPELETSRRLFSKEDIEDVTTKGSVPEVYSPGRSHFPDLHPIAAKPNSSRTSTDRNLGNDLGVPARASVRDNGTLLVSTSRPLSTGRAGGVDSVHISRPSSAGRTLMRSDSPFRRPAVQALPPIVRASGIESPTRKSLSSRAVGVVDTGPPALKSSSIRSFGSDSGIVSRPSTARTTSSVDRGHGGGGHFKGEVVLVPKRERASPTPLRKNGEEQLTSRQERLSGGGGGDASGSLSPEDSNARRRVIKDYGIRIRQAEARVVERNYDSEHRKRPYQDEEDQGPGTSSRKTRLIPDSDGRAFKGPRWDDSLQLKSARPSSPNKESRETREIALPEHGHRTTNGAESSKLRACVSSSRSQYERGGVRDGPELKLLKDVERLSENRSKESEQILSSAAGQDKGIGIHASKDAIVVSRHSHGSSSSHERFSFSHHQVKKELIPLSDKAEHEKLQQRPAILSRLSIPKPDSVPSGSSTRLRTDLIRQEKLISQANNLASLVSKKPSLAHVGNVVGSQVNVNPLSECIERPAPTQVSNIGDLENKTTSTTSLRTVSGKVAGKVLATREELNSQLSARLLELQIPDGSKREEERGLTRHTSISISPNGIKNVYSPFQKASDAFPRDSWLVEPRSNTSKPDSLQLRLEAPALPPTEDVLPFPAVNSREASVVVEVNEQSSSSSRAAPKLIFTGHKSDQSFKDISPQVDSAVRESHALPEKCDHRKAIVPVMSKASGDSAQRVELTESRNGIAVLPTTEDVFTSEAGATCPQLSLSKDKVKSIGEQVVTARKPSTISTSISLSLSTSAQPASSMGERVENLEFRERKSLSINISENLEKGEEVRPHAEHSLPRSSGLEKVELAIVPSAAPPSSSAPKEIRLFGATLIAPVTVMEPVDLSPKDKEEVKSVEPETAIVTATQEVQRPVVLPQTVESGAVSAKSGKARVVETAGDVKTEPPIAEKSISEQSHDVQKLPVALPEISQVQAQPTEPALQEKPSVTVPAAVKIPLAAVRPQSSARLSGPRTWVRSNASTSAPANSVLGYRATIAGTSAMSQPVGRGRGFPAGGAYVRKGNSLVRAPGAVTMPSSVPPASMLGQIRPPMVSHGPGQKHPFSKNQFPAPQDVVKNSQPVSRKGVGPIVESAGGGLSLSKSVPSSTGGGGLQGNSAAPVESGRLKIPPQVVLGAGTALKTGLNLSAPPPQQTGTSSQQTGASASLQNSAGDDSVNNPSKVAIPSAVTNSGSSVSTGLGSNNMTYVRTKANQLVVVAPCPPSVESSVVENQAVKPDLYFKRKINQLVRNSGLRASGSPTFVQVVLANEQPPKGLTGEGSRSSAVDKRTSLGRVLRQKKGPRGRSSFVWTLSGGTVSHGSYATVKKPAAFLFPWKRPSLTTSVRSRRLRTVPEGKKGSLLAVMSERLRRVRAVQPVYTRSADGFSLHRSGVLSVSGGNMKWTKSLETRAKLASEVATKAVAAAESRKREEKQAVVEAVKAKRVGRKVAKASGERIVWVGLHRYKMDAASKTLQRIPDTKGESGATMSSGPAKTLPLLTPRRSYIGGTTYLRVGNQLVRDPKAASQALASEKVRWSLHHARSRGAKKQQYCQFFTRFGKCNKENGKCVYIHDPDKVAVCTKFLKGACSDEQCLLTHKVIPERMPDCSYFLEGLCTNENCPYRHVNVNPKAPYCDGFLRGYCKDGDKCNKKHTYVCPTHAATGKCPEEATCKLHHPKRKGKFELAFSRKLSTKRKRRYFCSTETENRSKLEKDQVSAASSSLLEEEIPVEDKKSVSDDAAEFISLTNSEEQDGDAKIISPETQKPWSFPSGVVPSFLKASVEGESGPAQEAERWIRPTFLLKATSPAS